MNFYIDAFKNYAVFVGRASRKAYWMFILFHIIVSIILGILDSAFNLNMTKDQGLLQNIYGLAALLPSLGLGIRRMHDTNHSGWWILFPIVNIFILATKGSPAENKYGPVPVDPVEVAE